MPSDPTPHLAILGCGNMGGAIARSLLTARPSPVASILACDPDPEKRNAVEGAEPVEDPAEAVRRADVVLVAVKPQVVADVLKPLQATAGKKLIVSVAAGTTTAALEKLLPGARVVRTMPNTPLLVGKGAVALCRGQTASAEDLAIARSLFPGATRVDLDESQMDAATAVSGSGPAYFFAFVEALAAAGTEAGLPADAADILARRTLEGAAALLAESGESPADLRKKVTSPGGTTAAALASFAEGGLDQLVSAAVAAAARRGRELSKEAE